MSNRAVEHITARRERRRLAGWDKQARKDGRKARKKLEQQRKAEAIRAKYGRLGKPAPVVIKRLEDQ